MAAGSLTVTVTGSVPKNLNRLRLDDDCCDCCAEIVVTLMLLNSSFKTEIVVAPRKCCRGNEAKKHREKTVNGNHPAMVNIAGWWDGQLLVVSVIF